MLPRRPVLSALALRAIVWDLWSFLDNIAAAIIGCVIARRAFQDNVTVGFVAAIRRREQCRPRVDVLGDTTTAMMWIEGVSPGRYPALLASATAPLIFGIPTSLREVRVQPVAVDRAAALAPINVLRLLNVVVVRGGGRRERVATHRERAALNPGPLLRHRHDGRVAARMDKWLWIAAAGALGSLARYCLAGVVQRTCGEAFPYGTLAVNLLGCFLFGVVWCLAAERQSLGPEVRVVVLVGFLGAFTTFSTFAFENVEMARTAQWWMLAANVLAQNVLGVVGVILGAALARAL